MNSQVSAWVSVSKIIFISIILACSQSIRASDLLSDDFNTTTTEINPVWRFYDPYAGNNADESTLTYSGENALISVPDGEQHDAWIPSINNKAPRLLQPLPNTDFQIEVKFETEPKIRHQLQGIIVQQSDDEFLRFDIFYNITGISVFAAYIDNTTTAGSFIPHGEVSLGATFPNYQRVIRSGNSWIFRYSEDGINWTDLPLFTQIMTVTEVGVFAGTAVGNPEFLSSVDYFVDLDLDDTPTVSLSGTPINDSDTWTPPASPPPVINTWYAQPTIQFGAGISQQWANILGNVSSDINITNLTYTLNADPEQALPFGSTGFDYRLENEGDFNIEIDHAIELVTGPNTIVIKATDSDGQETTKSITINYAPANIGLPTSTYTVDWGSLSTIQDVESIAHVVDGLWELTADGIKTIETGYDRAVAIGDETWLSDNYEVTVPFTPHANYSGIGFGVGWQGHDVNSTLLNQSPRVGWPVQALAWVRGPNTNPSLEIVTYENVASNLWENTVGTPQTLSPLTFGDLYMLKTYSEPLGSGTSRFHVKFWKDGDVEPSTWNIEENVPTRNGSVLLVSYKGDVTFGNVSITPVSVPPDTTPPVIDNILVTVTDSTATITWDTDELSNSVVDYGFTDTYGINVNDATEVTSHSLSLSGLNSNTSYHYQVKSSDSSGNPANSVDQTFTTTVTADTTPPVVSNISTTITETTAVITWTTNEPSTSVLNYGETTAYGSTDTSDATLVTDHSVTLSGLTADTEYHFEIVSTDGSTNSSTSSDQIFTTATTTGNGWWDDNWNYRASVTVNSGNYARSEKPVELAINFTSYIDTADQATPFDENSIRVHEVDVNGSIIAQNISFQFDSATDFDATTNAQGTLVFLLSGSTASQTDRYFHVYFDVEGGGYTPSTFTNQVNVTNDVHDEGQNSFLIESDNADYFYQKQGAGFSSIVDSNGNDWISYHPEVSGESGAANQFRGLPNLVSPANGGNFHPGETTALSVLMHEGPLKATIESITTDGLWKVQWEFFPKFARMTVNLAEENYWFLYEGTPGGTLDLADFVMRSDETQNLVDASWTSDINDPEWVYFSDPNVGSGRSLFLAHHTDDSAIDSYSPLDSATDLQMTVFGFGRDGLNSFIDKNQTHQFTIGLTNSIDFASTAATIESAYRTISTTITSSDQNPDTGTDTIPPTIVGAIATAVTDTTATISWTTDEPSTSVINYGETTAYGSTDTSDATLVTAHSITLSGLTLDTEYHFEIVSTDGSSNSGTSADQLFTTAATADITPPVASAISTAVTDTTATITWTTDEPSTSVINYGESTPYTDSDTSDVTLVTDHSITLSGLTAETDYHFEIVSTDASTNSSPTLDQTFTTGAVSGTGDLIAYWALDEGAGTTATDNSGNGHDGTLVNGPAWSGNELIFDGVNDYIDAGTFDVPGQALTLAGWIQSDDLGSCSSFKDCRIISKADSTSEQDHYWMLSTIKVGSATRLRFRLKTDGVTSTLVASSGDLTNGVIFHAAATYDGTTMRLYKDGVEVGSLAKTGTIDSSATTKIWIGANPMVASDRPWQGLISDIRVYQTALTAAEVNTVKDADAGTADVIPPTIVGAIATAATDMEVTISWTTDEPSTSVINYGETTAYGSTDTSDATLVTDHSVTLSGLTLDTEYHFEIVSTDGSSNSGTSADQLFTTAATADITPPVASAISTAVTDTTATITWTTDEPSTSVINYGESTPYTDSDTSDVTLVTDHSITLSGLTAETDYHFEIVSTDASTNSSPTLDQTFTTGAVSGTGDLIAYWALDEGAGTTATDNSGNGHDGTLVNGPAWSGNELIFDGVNDYIDAGTFDVPGQALTLAGWIQSDDLGSCSSFKDCRIISKADSTSEQDHYWMLSTIKVGSATRLRFRLKTDGVTSTLVASSGDLTNGVIFHAAATYDGTTMRLYKDGVEVGSLAKTGTIDSSATTKIWIGANPMVASDRPWQGLISDIRVYQTALTAAEVNTVKDADAGTADVIPPTIVGAIATAATDMEVTISWTTDEPSTSVINYGETTAYGSTDTSDATLVTDHSVTLSGLTLDTEYHFEIVSTDGSSNSGTSADQLFTTAATADITPPVASAISTAVTDTTATITWTTDEPSTSVINYGESTPYTDSDTSDVTLVTDHSITLSGLTAETDYHFEIVSTDASTNSSPTLDQTFTTGAVSGTGDLIAYWALDEGAGTTATDNSGNGHDGTLVNGPAWSGNELIFDGVNDYIDAGTFDVPGQALTLAGWIQSDDLGSCSSFKDCRIISKADSTSEQDHYWMLSTIKVGSATRLRFRLKTDGVTSTLVASSGDLTNGVIFHAAATYDGTTMRLYKDGVEVGSLAKTGTIDSSATTKIWIGANPMVASDRPWQGLISDIRVYQTALTAAEVNTVKDADAGTADVIPPTIVGAIATAATDMEVTISWTTDEPSTSVINYGETTAYGSTDTSDATLVTDHSVTLSGLTLDTEYHFEIVSTDGSSNSGTSADQLFTTAATADITPPVASAISTAVTDTTATITWTTDEPSTSVINYGESTPYTDSDTSDVTLVTDHSVTLSGLTAETDYHFEIVSTDASTNSSPTLDQTFTTGAVSGTGDLIAYWALDEGAGTTATDNSGNGHDGTLVNGPAWSGNELIFDGVNDYIDAGTFDVPGQALTLAGWIQSDDLGSCSSFKDCRIISKADSTSEQDHYWMLSTIKVGSATRLRFRLKTDGVTSTLVASSGDLTNGVIFHAAATYDGTTMRLYKDGVEVGSLAKTGTIDSSATTKIWIGANPMVASDRPWQGLISDIRVYQTALTAAEVNTVKDADAGTADVIPPTIVGAIATAATDMEVTISWTTDEPSTSVINYGETTAYGSTDTSDATLVTDHSVTLSGLTLDTEYHFEIVSTDGSSNSGTSADQLFTTAATADITPPVASAISTAVTDTTATITWTTDEPSTSVINYGESTPYTDSDTSDVTLVTDHSITLSGLTAATDYHFEIVSTDASTNSSPTLDQTFSTNATTGTGDLIAHWSLDDNSGTVASDITGNGHNGTLVNGPIWNGSELLFDGVNDYVNVGLLNISGQALSLTGWVSSEQLDNCSFKDCRIISKSTGGAEQDHYFMLSTTKVGSQVYLRFRLKAGGSTSTLIASTGNLVNGEKFHVAATYDGTTMRLYKNGVEVGALAKTGSIDTNNTVDTWLGGTPGNASQHPWKGSLANVRIYQKTLTPTEVISVMNTDAVTDTTAPIVSNRQVAVTSSSAIITWNTNEAADSNLSYGPSNAYENGTVNVGSSVVSHSITLSGLTENTTYHYQLENTDNSNNTATSTDFTFITGAIGDGPELLMFDWNTVVTKANRGFPRDIPPMASANGDWTGPVNYATGTFYIRAEIKSGGQPVPQTMKFNYCIWQKDLVTGNNFGLEECVHLSQSLVGNVGNEITWSENVNSMAQISDDPLDWTRARHAYGIAIKNTAGNPVSDYLGWDWFGENPDEWYPLDVRFTVVVVPNGQTFSGWGNYIN